jgi:hypothetical protein
MDRRNGFLKFIAACIPGVGYMYLGLVKLGVQTLALFLLIRPVFRLLSIDFLTDIVLIPFWFFTFFDTFSLSNKMDRGEAVNDTDFIFKRFNKSNIDTGNIRVDIWKVAAWILIVLGVLAILNKALYEFPLYGLIKSFVSSYFIPVLFVSAGIYLLLKRK